MRDAVEEEFKQKQIDYYKQNVEGKLFYGDGQTWNGYEGSLRLIKPTTCTDFGYYNSCNVIEFEITYPSKGEFIFKLHKRTFRVDSFNTHYKELTEELLNKVINKAGSDIKQVFDLFKIQP